MSKFDHHLVVYNVDGSSDITFIRNRRQYEGHNTSLGCYTDSSPMWPSYCLTGFSY